MDYVLQRMQQNLDLLIQHHISILMDNLNNLLQEECIIPKPSLISSPSTSQSCRTIVSYITICLKPCFMTIAKYSPNEQGLLRFQ